MFRTSTEYPNIVDLEQECSTFLPFEGIFDDPRTADTNAL